MAFVCPQAPCLLLLVLVVAAPSTLADVSVDDVSTIHDGLSAGKDFADSLAKATSSKKFTASLEKMSTMIGPWVDGIGVFSAVLGMFMPEDDAVLNAIVEGFFEVNHRLDAIKDGLEEVVEAIDWAVVKTNFMGIEQDIRLMDDKLKEVYAAPNAAHGKQEFIRVYENEYHTAGTLLWDAMVAHDSIFSENILSTLMGQTDYHRAKMNRFMKGCIALLMKATNIEVSYEKFKGHDRGITDIWKQRLLGAQKALEDADQELKDAWRKLFPGEVDKMSKDCKKKCSNKRFADLVYNFLTGKYPWMSWAVLVYPDVRGYDEHAIKGTFYHQFRHYGHNFMISWIDPSTTFDANAAKAAVKAVEKYRTKCQRFGKNQIARKILNGTPSFGVSKAVVPFKKWAVRAEKGRYTKGMAQYSFCSMGFKVPIMVFYFG